MATRPTRGVTSALGARQATSTSMPTTVRGPGTPDGSTGSERREGRRPRSVSPGGLEPDLSHHTGGVRDLDRHLGRPREPGRLEGDADPGGPGRQLGCGGTTGQRRGGSLPLGSVGEPAGERVEGRRGDRDERADVAAQLGGHGGDRVDVRERGDGVAAWPRPGPADRWRRGRPRPPAADGWCRSRTSTYPSTSPPRRAWPPRSPRRAPER